jgi:hypothetical protein
MWDFNLINIFVKISIFSVDINYDGMQDIIYITYESTSNTYTVNTLIQT